MKKLCFLLGLGSGFLLGSKAGSGPYEKIAGKARSVTSRPEVREAMGEVKGVAQDQVDAMANRVGQQASEKAGGSGRQGPAGPGTADGAGSGPRQAPFVPPGAPEQTPTRASQRLPG